MSKIVLDKICVSKNSLSFNFSFSDEIKKFFRLNSFDINYPCDIESVPNSILAVPFVSNVLPIVWLTDSELVVDSLDEDFLNCISELKKSFSKMFPETVFGGKVSCFNIVKNKPKGDCNIAGLFFSAGLDSVQTLISHFDEQPDLITIWGSDINYYNSDGWNRMYEHISTFCKEIGLNSLVIHSMFREFDFEGVLDSCFSKQLRDEWWHGLKHGIGLIGHVAPIAFLKGYKRFYIASTHCNSDKNVRCSSHPSTDNCIRFCGCQIVHDGFQYSRQDKIRNVLNFKKNNLDMELPLHVCWETQSGDNCCSCEKCARTIYAILAEGGDPSIFGFKQYKKVFISFNRTNALIYFSRFPHVIHSWDGITKAIRKNKDILRNKSYWKNIKWLAKIYFNNKKTYKIPLFYRIKQFIKNKVFRRIKKLFRFIKYYFYLKQKSKKSVFLIGTPNHSNIGDSAITLAEMSFIKEIGFHPVEISCEDFKYYKRVIKFVSRNKLVLLQGGGNMGDLWPNEEKLRQDIIETLNESKIIVMPQTFFISNKEDASFVQTMIDTYNREEITIFAREPFSYNNMKEFFPKSNVFLCPDIVISLKNKLVLKSSSKQVDILLVLRDDLEKTTSFSKESIIQLLKENGFSNFMITDMHHTSSINSSQRSSIINDKFNEFLSAKIVITDRLHGMIFAYLTNTPCIVLSNNNYKISGVYNWLRDSSIISFIDNNISEIPTLIKQMLNSHGTNKYNEEWFDILEETIKKEYAKN